jgi:hypothetical protein
LRIGLSISLKRLFHDVLVKGEVNDLLQPGILLLQVIQSLDLIPIHRTVLPLPSVVGLFDDANVTDRVRDGATFCPSGFYIAQLRDNLIRSVSSLFHGWSGWVEVPD